MAGPDEGRPAYGKARIGAAATFVAVVSVLALGDAVRTDYVLEPIILGLFCGIILALLGVAGFERFMGPPK